jgi:hypothetical protein
MKQLQEGRASAIAKSKKLRKRKYDSRVFFVGVCERVKDIRYGWYSSKDVKER